MSMWCAATSLLSRSTKNVHTTAAPRTRRSPAAGPAASVARPPVVTRNTPAMPTATPRVFRGPSRSRRTNHDATATKIVFALTRRAAFPAVVDVWPLN